MVSISIIQSLNVLIIYDLSEIYTPHNHRKGKYSFINIYHLDDKMNKNVIQSFNCVNTK